VGFDVADQLLIRFIRYGRKKGSTVRQYIGLQESVWFNEEESIVKYSHRIWDTQEISQVD
jgi:hypothetical protein